MIHLLFPAIFAEMAMVMVQLFKTPPRKPVIMVVDRLKRGRGPVMVKTVAGTVFALLMSSAYSALNIQNRWMDDGSVIPTVRIRTSRPSIFLKLHSWVSFDFSIV